MDTIINCAAERGKRLSVVREINSKEMSEKC